MTKLTPEQQKKATATRTLRKAYQKGELAEEQISRLEAIGFKFESSRKPLLAEAAPHLISRWHPTLNDDKTPFNTTEGSPYEAWWVCSGCGGEFKMRVGEYVKKAEKSTLCRPCLMRGNVNASRRAVVFSETGEVYPSMTAAAEDTGLTRRQVGYALKKHEKGLGSTWRYATEEEASQLRNETSND